MDFPVEGREDEKDSLVVRYEAVRDNVFSASVNGKFAARELLRSRKYALPGLRSEAPRTEPLYRLFSRFVEGRTVLDVGSGSGVGALVLSSAAEYLGVDSDPNVVALSRSLVPNASFESLDIEFDELPEIEVAVVVDVLGALGDPLVALRRIARVLPEEGVLLVAEPEATIAQGLLAPAKRAFSQRELARLLERAGFRLRGWELEKGFLAGVFERSEAFEKLVRVHEAALAGHYDEAAQLLEEEPLDSSALAFELRAVVERARGNFGAAFDALCRGNARCPEDPGLLVRLSEFALECGESTDAKRFAEAALALDRASGEAWCALAVAHGSEATPEVLAIWSNASRLLPSSLPVAAEFARTAAVLSHFSIGILALERAASYVGTLPIDVHGTLGLLHALAGNVDAARLEAHHIKVVEPHHPVLADLDGILEAKHAA